MPEHAPFWALAFVLCSNEVASPEHCTSSGYPPRAAFGACSQCLTEGTNQLEWRQSWILTYTHHHCYLGAPANSVPDSETRELTTYFKDLLLDAETTPNKTFQIIDGLPYTMELSAWGQVIYRGRAALGLVAPGGSGLPVTALGYKIMTNKAGRKISPVSREPTRPQ